jgi:hypothetical protein
LVTLLFTIRLTPARDLTIVAEMKTICDQFEAYGYSACWRRTTRSWHCRERKKIRRLMREHELPARLVAAVKKISCGNIIARS